MHLNDKRVVRLFCAGNAGNALCCVVCYPGHVSGRAFAQRVNVTISPQVPIQNHKCLEIPLWKLCLCDRTAVRTN